MLPDDFFSFCTSLPVEELRAVGALSRVKHYAEGELVYSTGDQSDEFFIINRGLVEIIPGAGLPGGSVVLGRGNMFGEAGAFTRTPRDQSARACAMLSVQCFKAKDFPELVRRVPSFVLFLCENMTRQLIQARTIEAGCELAGSLVNFDLITIYQTIVRSMRTGTLFINDERGELISEFYFESGTPQWGRFQHLLGEEAFWQLFIQPRKSWTFTFSREKPTGADFKEHKSITRGSEEMLIEAVRMRDEFETLQELMGEATAVLKRRQLNFAWPTDEVEALRPMAEEIWQIAYSEPISLVDLCGRCNTCALKVFQAVAGMLRANLFSLTPTEKNDRSQDATRPGDTSIAIVPHPSPTTPAPSPSRSKMSALAG
jgi:hypothetical protein